MTPERYARIKALFAQAIRLSQHERSDFLERECQDDAELKRELQSLLEHDHSQTIISAEDPTVSDLDGVTRLETTRQTLSKRLQGWSMLTKHLTPRGYLAIGALWMSLILGLFGYVGYRSIYRFQKELRREALNEIVDGKVLALEMWLDHEKRVVESWARSHKLQRYIAELVTAAGESTDIGTELTQFELQQEIRDELSALAGRELSYSIWDRQHRVVADQFAEANRIGSSATPWGSSILAYVFQGNSRLMMYDDRNLITRLEPSISVEPHLAVVTPILGSDGKIIAALLIHDDQSRRDVSRILAMFNLGKSGETYVFNRDGLMLSDSRFGEQLRSLGMIPDDPNITSGRRIYLRDPGVDLTKGGVPDGPLSSQPLTRMARLCIAEQDGVDLEGYRDYRGVEVVGAWRWLEELDVGVATELDVDEAEPGIGVLIWETWIIGALLAICASIAGFSYYSVARLRQEFGENRKLGQYVLEKQIGEGGMGKVFKARHELLKRPTAIKLLRPELVDRESRARFEREARLVSLLEHPNTIRIYDYGQTPEGLFFYVMEFIDGLSLGETMQLDSVIPPARVIHLLRQICYSLREAHEAGLVHRDLKPANIMICQRGGESDVIKVLDFGLIKHVTTAPSQQITSTAMVAGTPQYIAPERLSEPETNDPRSDLYSLGLVAFFLLTGEEFIQGDNLASILSQVVNAPRRKPSQATSQSIPAELDDLVSRCIAVDPEDRPSSAEEILQALDAIVLAEPWEQSDAESWWTAFPGRCVS